MEEVTNAARNVVSNSKNALFMVTTGGAGASHQRNRYHGSNSFLSSTEAGTAVTGTVELL